MPNLRLVPPRQPRSGRETFKLISAILKQGEYIIPPEKRYNGNGGPGEYLQYLLNVEANNRDTPDFKDWEIKFHGGTAPITLFHKDPEPRGIIRAMVHTFGWPDEKKRISFRHTIWGKTNRGFYVANEEDRIVIRNRHKDAAVPHWTHNTLQNALPAKLRRLIVVTGRMKKNPRRVIYDSAAAYWEVDVKGFAEAVTKGTIAVDFDARTQKGAGSAIRNHGTKFRIKAEDLGAMYASKIKIT
jgi:hypothetical protein